MRTGSLFSGYLGLEMAVNEVFDATTAWVSDIDKGACKILAHRAPGVPNLGDITKIDWATVEPVDILTGGSPCQDLSHAGKRQGMSEGTRSNLWVAMREAIAQLRPRIVVWENVRGAYSAEADSDLEFCPGCMGERRPGVVLRALGRVLGDLCDLGYDARWHGLRAADVGAPHGRFRVFVVATDAQCGGLDGWAPEPVRRTLGGTAVARPGEDLLPTPVADNSRGLPSSQTDYQSLANAVTSLLPTPRATRGGSNTETVGLLPTPTTRDHKGRNQRDDDTCLTGALLPTPAVNDMGAGKTVEDWDAWTAKMKAEHGNGNGHGPSLSIEALRLLPTPMTSDASPGPVDPLAHDQLRSVSRRAQDWGQYADAITRWEHLTRPAPAPTEPGAKGNPRLAPVFSEWMIGIAWEMAA